MLPLYPEIKPYARHKVKVDDIHELYVDESGIPHGIPILFVHSGPGSGCEFDSRCFFNPEKYRIVLFDQRGSGRSTPHGELEGNDTAALVEDMEKIREHLGIDKWVVFGGGWGSTLSLVYAETYPERVIGLVLRGVFLGRKPDIDWIYQKGLSRFYPDYWEDFKAPIPQADRGNYLEAYAKRMEGSDELARMAAAKAWSRWEADCATLHPNQRLIRHLTDPHRAMARCRIGAHYFSNQCFLEENQIIEGIDAIQDIPGIIVHGRFDLLCPLENAHTLHEAWPISQLYIVREAGHSATEAPLIDALIRATRDIARRFEADFGL
ncbi:MAG TPA: prolyl aminopeptidase [Pseudomonadales bacterium]|nr:prolyl aminopeptidase [Pseudomonadales bacterium]